MISEGVGSLVRDLDQGSTLAAIDQTATGLTGNRPCRRSWITMGPSPRAPTRRRGEVVGHPAALLSHQRAATVVHPRHRWVLGVTQQVYSINLRSTIFACSEQARPALPSPVGRAQRA